MSVHKLVEKKLDGKQQKLAAQDHRGTAKFVDQRSSAQTTTELQNTILSANDAPTNLVLQQKRGIEESPILQRKSSRDGLPPQLQSGIEALSGMSMNHVQVHYNSPKPATLQAHAYAQGSQIHLGPGQEKHLPHEAWHVVQQAQGRVKPTMQMRNKVNINDDHGLEREADVMGAKAMQMRHSRRSNPDAAVYAKVSTAQRRAAIVQRAMKVNSLDMDANRSASQNFAEIGIASPEIAQLKSLAPESSVVQRVVDVGGQVLLEPNLGQLLAQLGQAQQHQLNQMVASRAHTYSFANLQQLYGHLHGQGGNDPVITPLDQGYVKNARRARNRTVFHKKTVRESPLAKHNAFHNIPRDQLYRLPNGHYWRRNPLTKKHERFRKRTLQPIKEESLYEYVDPKDSTKENYGYLQGRRVITTRTDPSSSAKFSRSGASGKILYKDKRGGQISERVFPEGKKKPFKRKRDDKTFTIGHSQAVKNMSKGKDHTGLNSDEQPNMMVPENRTVGEQMKNPALEPEDRPYVWNNFYDQNPETTYSGHPIPKTTEATLFHPNGSLDVNIKLTNDGSVDYRKEREKLRVQKGVKKLSYDTYMREKTKAPYAPPHTYDSEDEDSIADIQEDVPSTPSHFPSYLEEDDLETHDEHQYGSMIDHKGKKFTVDTIKKEETDGKKTYSLSLLKSYQFDLTEFQKIVAQHSPQGLTPTSTSQSDEQQQKGKGDAPKTKSVDSKSAKLKDLKRSQATVLRIAAQMNTTVSPLVLQNPIVQHNLQQLQQQVHAANNALQNLDLAQDTIYQIYQNMYQIFRAIEPVLVRGLSAGGGNSTTNLGNRLPALTQYFSECGQMAVHNLLALHNAAAENNNFANLNNHLRNEQNLRGIGNFQNNIAEGDIRQLLANAGRQGVPVVGNLHQVQNFIGHLNHHNPGQGTLVGDFNAQQALAVFGVQNQEYRELVNMNNFLAGRSNALNMIINTEANEQIAQGHHWITVRLERAQNGTIHIHFVDSWPGDADYQELFAGLRVFVAQGQIQNGLQNGLQSTSTPVKKLQN